jgi:hypothetical protein
MASVIEMVDDKTFRVSNRGSMMTLTKQDDGTWTVGTHNACTRAYRGQFGSYRYFATLADVEAAYKSWRGIAVLISASTGTETNGNNDSNLHTEQRQRGMEV